MQEKKDTLMSVIRWGSIILMLAIIVLQFLPFWNIDGKQISVAAYMWWPEKNKELTEFMRTTLGNSTFDVRNILNEGFVQILTAVLGIFWYLTRKNDFWTVVVPVICSVVGIWAYVMNPAFRYGGNWILQLVLNVILLALSVIRVIKIVKNFEIITK